MEIVGVSKDNPSAFFKFGVCNLIINGALGILFGIYTLNNPDKTECWVVDGWTIATAERTRAEINTNVAGAFHKWFMWGFIFNITACILGFL